jgi:hypothetical protein
MDSDTDCWLSEEGTASGETLSRTLVKLMLNPHCASCDGHSCEAAR